MDGKRGPGSAPWATVDQRQYLHKMRSDYLVAPPNDKTEFWVRVMAHWEATWGIGIFPEDDYEENAGPGRKPLTNRERLLKVNLLRYLTLACRE
jgi:hypothetical protein